MGFQALFKTAFFLLFLFLRVELELNFLFALENSPPPPILLLPQTQQIKMWAATQKSVLAAASCPLKSGGPRASPGGQFLCPHRRGRQENPDPGRMNELEKSS